jgi:hypothetical protein
MKSKQTRGVTEWFPSSINPVRAGVYEVHTPNCKANRYAYYDAKGWRLCASTIREAKLEKFIDAMSCSSMVFPRSEWRGLSSKP